MGLPFKDLMSLRFHVRDFKEVSSKLRKGKPGKKRYWDGLQRGRVGPWETGA